LSGKLPKINSIACAYYFDAGASLTHQASQCVEQEKTAGQRLQILKCFGIVAPTFNEGIHKEAHLYCKGDLEPLSSRP
jgi:hypothetical protein